MASSTTNAISFVVLFMSVGLIEFLGRRLMDSGRLKAPVLGRSCCAEHRNAAQ